MKGVNKNAPFILSNKKISKTFVMQGIQAKALLQRSKMMIYSPMYGSG
jgi:hypothetical protein